MYQIIREVKEIEWYLNNMNSKHGFSLSMSWEPHIHTLKQQNSVVLKDKEWMPTSFGLPLHWSQERPFCVLVLLPVTHFSLAQTVL
jgi:hypothetical protein